MSTVYRPQIAEAMSGRVCTAIMMKIRYEHPDLHAKLGGSYNLQEGVRLHIVRCVEHAVGLGKDKLPRKPTTSQASRGLTPDLIAELEPLVRESISAQLLRLIKEVGEAAVTWSDIFAAEDALMGRD